MNWETETERMLAGELYNARDPQLLAIAHRACACWQPMRQRRQQKQKPCKNCFLLCSTYRSKRMD